MVNRKISKIAMVIGLVCLTTCVYANGTVTKKSKSSPKKLYAAKSRVGLAAVNEANRRALQRPKLGSYVNSIMNFTYMPGALYQIYCAPLSITDLQFEVGERVVSVAAGDTLRWEVSKTFSGLGESRVEHLLIKPIESDITNSMVITTTLRTYHLRLHSTEHAYMAVVNWRYPNSRGFVRKYRRVADERVTTASHGLSLKNMDFDYKIYLVHGGQPSWLPITIFNDGKKTYIQFPKNMQEAPTLFLGEKNNIRAVNYRVKGDYFIVDNVIEKAQLRLGQGYSEVIQIVHGGH